MELSDEALAFELMKPIEGAGVLAASVPEPPSAGAAATRGAP